MSQTISLILLYKYYILLPLAILEGPFLAVISGFFISTGYLSFIPVYIIVVLGDVIGDAIFYGIGRWGRKNILSKFGKFLKINDEKLEQAKFYFNLHQRKALVFSKLIHGIGITGLIAAGSLKIPYWKFMRVCVFVSILQSALIITLGIIFGRAYTELAKYLDYYAAGATILTIIIIIFVIFRRMKINIKP